MFHHTLLKYRETATNSACTVVLRFLCVFLLRCIELRQIQTSIPIRGIRPQFVSMQLATLFRATLHCPADYFGNKNTILLLATKMKTIVCAANRIAWATDKLHIITYYLRFAENSMGLYLFHRFRYSIKKYWLKSRDFTNFAIKINKIHETHGMNKSQRVTFNDCEIYSVFLTTSETIQKTAELDPPKLVL